MIDHAKAVQDAVFAALNVPAMTALSPVHQHVPDDAQPPLTIVADIALEPAGGKDGGLDRAGVEIVTLYRGPKRASLYAMQAKVRELIEGAALTATGAALSRPVFDAQDDEILEDGVTYLGTQRFSLFVQASD